MAGEVRIAGGPPVGPLSFLLTRRARALPARPYTVESITVNGRGVRLAARVCVPRTPGSHPALVLLHGSSLNLAVPYAFYADAFARSGFEVLTFDKRGNGGSSGSYAAASYDDLVDDAVAWLCERAGISRP